MDDGYCVLHRPELNLSHLSDGLRVPVLIHHQPSDHMQLRAREASLGKRLHVPHKVLVDPRRSATDAEEFCSPSKMPEVVQFGHRRKSSSDSVSASRPSSV